MDPFTPIFLLLLGALAMLVGGSRSFRVNGMAALTTAFFAVIVTVLLGFRLPVVVVLSRWQSEPNFGDSLRLAADGASWLVALALLLALLAACLVGLSGRTEQTGLQHAGSLLVIACALAAVFADNLMTLAMAWVALDLVIYCSLVLVRGESGAVAEFSVRLLAIALVIAAALVGVESGEMPVLSGGELSAQSVTLLMVAVMLRLGLYPVHVGARRVVESRQAVVEIESVTWLAAWAVSVDLLSVLASQPEVLPLRIWLTVAALASGLLGGWRWYSSSLPREQLKHMFMAQAGVTVLTFLWGGDWAVVGVIARGLSVMLGGSVLLLCRGNVASARSSALINPLLAVPVLGSLPLTVGFVGALVLYSGLLRAGMWVLVLPVAVVIEAMLMAGAFRLALFGGGGPPMQAPFARAGYHLGLTIPAAAAVLAGLAPDQLAAIAGVVDMPGWSGMLTPGGFSALGSTLLAGGIGAGLWSFREQLQTRTVGAEIHRLGLLSMFELRWMHSAIWTLYRWVARVMRAAALVLEGHGGVLWALVLVTIVWLALGG